MSGSPDTAGEYFADVGFVEDMLQRVVKKDEDARVRSMDPRSGSVQVETSLNLTEQDFCQVHSDDGNDLENAIDSALLRDDATGVSSDVSIRIVFTVFSVTTAYHFVTATVGILFYLVLLYDESKTVAIVLCSVTGTLCAVFYCLSAWQRKTYRGIVFFAQLAFIRVLLVASLSQLIGNELLYLLEIVYLFQAGCIIIYTTKWPRDEPPTNLSDSQSEFASNRCTRMCGGAWAYAYNSRYAIIALTWILTTSTLVWIIGIVLFAKVFFRELIWLWGILLYFCIVFVSLYKWRYIGNMLVADGARYSISMDDRKLAVIEYYADPIVSVWNKVSGI